jgi:1-acyl-sn-glycerol-3-phosphate acyltransferase
MFAKIRFYWGAFVISSIVALIMIPLITLFPKYKGTIMHKLNRVILFLMGAKLKTFGKRDKNANLYLINHQGIMDIIALEAVENAHFRWVAKKELFETPWFGHLLKNGDMISVDRDNKAGLVKLLKDAKETVEKKERVIAIFPEGTRAKNQKLLPFKAGAKIIANKLDMRVQPIVVTGSKWVLNEHNKTGHSGTIRIHYLEPIDVKNASNNWYEEIKEQMQAKIDEEEKKGFLR